MIELRYVLRHINRPDLLGEEKVLQYRKRNDPQDYSTGRWSEWIDVPTEEKEYE